MSVKFKATIVLAVTLGLTSAFAAEKSAKGGQPEAIAPQRVEAELEPAGVASGTTVRQARITQNWVLVGLGSAALAGIIFGLSSSDDATSTTN